MMKKSLIALATLGAMAGSAFAANVDIYGVVDTGLVYTHSKYTAKKAENTLQMMSGYNAASRFGLVGTEDLGNGMTVGFKLENSFNSDDGTLGNDGRLFGREAQVNINGAFGTIAMGRMGALTSSAGTYDIFFAAADAFDGGDNEIGTGFAMTGRYDNMITYATPEFAGLKVYAQYSFATGADDKLTQEQAHTGANQRYIGLGATYTIGNLGLVATVDQVRNANATNPAVVNEANKKDQTTYNIGANYDCGFAKSFIGFQYAQNANSLGEADADAEIDTKNVVTEGLKGYALTVGTIVPVAGGDLTAAIYYANGKNETAGKFDVEYIAASARYVYPLSQRTSLYAGAGYGQSKLTTDTAEKAKAAQVYTGLTHTF